MAAERIEAVGRFGKLVIEFPRVGDRLGHRLLIARPDETRELLAAETEEGTAADHWPMSPPLQSLLIEPRPQNTQVGLLVGMAETAHWSASFETLPGAAEILIDIACRVSKSPEFLGVTYRIEQGETPPWSILPIENAEATTETNHIIVRCTAAATGGRQTLRWRYKLALESNKVV